MRYKTSTEAIFDPMSGINALSGFYFNWTSNAPLDDDEDTGRSLGMSAQNVNSVFPELVKSGSAHGPSGEIPDFMTVNYAGLSTIFVEALKNIDQRLKNLENN
jgi:hypothetical protein